MLAHALVPLAEHLLTDGAVVDGRELRRRQCCLHLHGSLRRRRRMPIWIVDHLPSLVLELLEFRAVQEFGSLVESFGF